MEDFSQAQLINLMTDQQLKSQIKEQVKYSSMGSMQKIRSISAKPPDFNIKNLKNDFIETIFRFTLLAERPESIKCTTQLLK